MDGGDHRTRRSVLAGGTALVALLAGCFGGGQSTPTDAEPTGTPTGPPTTERPSTGGTASSRTGTASSTTTESSTPTTTRSTPAGTGDPRWRVEFDRAFEGLALGEDVVYASGDQLHALDPVTGAIRWSFDPVGPRQTVQSRPILGGGSVYVTRSWFRGVSYKDSGIVAVTPSGDRHWTRATTGFPRRVALDGSDLVFGTADDVLRSTGERLVSLSAATGRERWRAPVGDAEHLTLDGTNAYLTDWSSAAAFDRATGERRWERPEATALRPGPGGLVYHLANSLVALDAATGRERWRDGAEGWVVAGVRPDGDGLYATGFPATGPTGSRRAVRALDAVEGTERWRRTLPREVHDPVGAADGTVVVDGNRVYGLDAADGTVRWRSEAVFEFGMDATVDRGNIYAVASDGGGGRELFSWRAGTGDLRWRHEARAAVQDLAVGPGTVYLGLEGGEVVALAD